MDSDLRTFIRQSIPSVLALEVLLFLRAHAEDAWTPETVAAALRNSPSSCDAIMASLASRGLLARRGTDYAYAPDPPKLDHLAERLQHAYSERRVAVINAIVGNGT
jgi:DNA-binding IclR family transcriptional regulator